MRTYVFCDAMPDPRTIVETAAVSAQAEPAEPVDEIDVEDIYLELGVGD